ncbi:MAG: PhzF family phenazine biosynthesis protein [Gemmataceae bacterium]
MTSSEPIRYFIIDAFTERPFAGNPAAVVLLSRWPRDGWLGQVAAEMNLSETAFLVPSATGYDLRWFTPTVEVDLCGHATLASTRALLELGQVAPGGEVRFATRSGTLTARVTATEIELNFPVKREQPAEPPAGLIEALGLVPRYVGRNAFDYLVEAESEAVVRSLTPDFGRLSAVACRGIIVTARSDDPAYDFVSRFFAPAAGVNEDPVTGSAHCALAAFWAPRLGKTQFRAYQASRRGGVLRVELAGERVLLGGQAVIVARGELGVSAEDSAGGE